MPDLLTSIVAALISALPCWSPPVNARISDPYRQPACTYCAGNRGIEYTTRNGQPVIAVETGVVSFAGTVAGILYVVVDHRDGRRATYGKLASVSVSRGDPVVAGLGLGTTTRQFYFGLRKGLAPNDEPVDPTPMLGVRRYPVRLVPVDGTPTIAPGPGRLSCGKFTLDR